jgi:hypothetical protein
MINNDIQYTIKENIMDESGKYIIIEKARDAACFLGKNVEGKHEWTDKKTGENKAIWQKGRLTAVLENGFYELDREGQNIYTEK